MGIEPDGLLIDKLVPEEKIVGCPLTISNVYVTMFIMVIKEYIEENGQSPFARWFDDLNSVAAAKVTTALYRLEQGNYSNVKSVGEGVLEYKIDFGPGYRIYFGKDGAELIILLGGGSKKQQNKDINLAKQKWGEYKKRK